VEHLSILDKFVVGGDESDEGWKLGPFLVSKEGVFWSVVTCHHTLVAFKDAGAIPIPDSPDFPFLWLPRDPLATQVDKTEVRVWTKVQDSNLIELGKYSVNSAAQGIIVGVLLDIRKLAYLLDQLPSQKLFMWDSTSQIGVHSLGVESEDGMWRAYIAGLGGESDTKKVFKGSGTEYTDAFKMMLDLE
jgi:hypothetical protein